MTQPSLADVFDCGAAQRMLSGTTGLLVCERLGRNMIAMVNKEGMQPPREEMAKMLCRMILGVYSAIQHIAPLYEDADEEWFYSRVDELVFESAEDFAKALREIPGWGGQHGS